jgi:hypothetical protein
LTPPTPHNARFARPATLAAKAFVAADPALLAEALCVEEERVVARDNTVTYGRRTLQLPASPARAHYVKARVKVREYPDGTLAVFHGPRRIARYSAQATPITAVPTPTSVTPCSPPSRRGLAAPEPAAPPQRRPSLTAATRGVTRPRQVGTWRNRGTGSVLVPINANGARPCLNRLSINMLVSMCP